MSQQKSSVPSPPWDARLALARQSRPETVNVTVVIPVYNEQAAIELFMDEFQNVERQLTTQGCSVRYLFVNDGSLDQTLETLIALQCRHHNVDDLSRNFGKEAALTAGIADALEGQADVIVPIDVDLQDPRHSFWRCWTNGAKATRLFWPAERIGRQIIR